MVRVKVGTQEAHVEDGVWSGDSNLAALGRAVEPFGGVPASFPDRDWRRAQLLAEAAGGEVLDPAIVSAGLPPDAQY